MSDFRLYRKKNLQAMRPYIPGECLKGVSVNSDNTGDRWYVAKKFFDDNYESAD